MIRPDTPLPTFDSRFPIPLDEVASYLKTFGQLDQAELDVMAASQSAFASEATPLGHMWDLMESPGLHGLGEMCRRYQPRLPGGRPDYSPLNGLKPLISYRVAACLGQTVINAREQRLRQAGSTVPEVRLDPLRRYLQYPEDASGDNLEWHWNRETRCDSTGRYLHDLDEQQYFDSPRASHSLEQMLQLWKEHRLGMLLGMGREQLNNYSVPLILEGVTQLWRLYRIGEQEAALAPWGQPYDMQQHQLVTRHTMPYNSAFSNHRSWSPTIRYADGLTPEAQAILGTPGRGHKQLLQYGKQLLAVGRVLEGSVPLPDDPQRFAQVRFKHSRQEFSLRPDDVLIVARGQGDRERFRALCHPFVARMGGLSIQALCRGGKVAQLATRYSPAGLTVADKDLYAAINAVITGHSTLDESAARACFDCSIRGTCGRSEQTTSISSPSLDVS